MKKPLIFLSPLLLACMVLMIALNATSQGTLQKEKIGEEFVCLPCGSECDKTVYNKDGNCTHCKMRLVKKSTVVFNSIQPFEVCNYVAAHPGVILLDVRTKAEFEGKANPDFGHLKNAVNIPIQELKKRLSELEAYKGRQIIVYCSRSHRSPQASYLLSQNGFLQVTNMYGGMSKWDNTGKSDCKAD